MSRLQESAPPERRHRKSVAFAEDETLIDGNGEITRATTNGSDEKTTAESHSQRASTTTNVSCAHATDTPKAANGSADVDEASAAFDELALAKKKKKSKKKEAEKDEAGDAPAAEGDFDLAALKKKKKKSKSSKTDDTDDFDAKLAKSEGGEKDAPADDADEPVPEDAGDMDEGTGVWQHDSTAPVHYNLLLSRFFKLLDEHNPDIGSGKSYKIPPPQCLREGNKKTIFANIPVSV